MSNLEIENLPIAAVEFNPWNPNKQSDRQFEAEVESILSNGFIAPILTRKIGKDKWQVIDGEHRKRALDIIIAEQRSGAGNITDLVATKTIPAIVLDVDDAHAKRLTIIMNETRGRADMGSLALLLADISAELGAELITGLPYTQGQLDEMLKLSEFDWDSLAIPETDIEPSDSSEHSDRVVALLDEATAQLWKKAKTENAAMIGKGDKESAGKLIRILLDRYNNL